jgi:hypothetical protein
VCFGPGVKRQINNIVGPQVSKLRVQRAWSQSKLAIKLQMIGWDVSRGTVAKIEGCTHCVREYQICYLMQVFGVQYCDLLPSTIDPHGKDLFEKITARLKSRY